MTETVPSCLQNNKRNSDNYRHMLELINTEIFIIY